MKKILSKKLKKSPIEISKDLEKLKIPIFIEKIKAVGPYLNFYINKKQILKHIFKEKQNKLHGTG